ncbi:hypothetical protein M422DRAFT_252812 [Sphaerobolus stellatus SS14]|uniref:Uncharacterized protein n=1 Tax=Sphaerobolus stellatus (strain SS14) TaxID=990650 RepID=A0A0C9VZC4_SPHS4|nr:hypothetical protein M422DRAFT_252812 [Sphaerobolus stellatus SS14]
MQVDDAHIVLLRNNQDSEGHEADIHMEDGWPSSPTPSEFEEGSSSGIPRARDLSPNGLPSPNPNVPVFEADTTVIDEFPEEYQAGRTYGQHATRWERMQDERIHGSKDKWGGFGGQEEWELARWMMKSGLSQGEIDKYLKLRIRTEDLELWKRNPVDCIREIIGNPALNQYMHYSPIKIFSNGSCDEQIFNEMCTVEWWWDIQYELPKGSTIASIIIASDATMLSQFGGDKSAWPVYITIGNVDKAIHCKPSWRATVLLGYLPISKLECFKETECTAERRRLFHYAMSRLLAPLKEAALEGVEMTCADGYVRKIHPILAAYVADFPEQCLVTCCKQSRCPRCKVRRKKRGTLLNYPPRHVSETLDIFNMEYHGNHHPQAKADGVTTDVLAPFWADLPYTDIFSCMTPYILHQLHKGVFKDHLVKWCSTLAGAEELDKHLQTMTTHAGLHQFKKGISVLKQWTGAEAKHLEKVFLGVLAGAVDAEAFRATRAIIDFIYYLQFSSHTTKTLQYMEDALIEFHHYKEVFIHYGVREDFNFPKLHSMNHYIPSIITHDTMDGYNTELPERLHINLAKEGYRASNHHDYETQMIRWLRRQESVDGYTAFLEWVIPEYEAIDLESESDEEDEEDGELAGMMESEPNNHSQGSGSKDENEDDTLACPPGSTSWQGQTIHTVAKHVPLRSIPVQVLTEDYGAIDFIPCLQVFVSQNLPYCQLRPREADVFDVYKHLKLQYRSLQGFGDPPEHDTCYGLILTKGSEA